MAARTTGSSAGRRTRAGTTRKLTPKRVPARKPAAKSARRAAATRVPAHVAERSAPPRERTDTARDFFPDRLTLPRLREAAAGCRACPLWRTGTQTVFGEGPRGADVMFVGEQPGDKEDLAGHPFVGPSGQLLDSALEDAGIDRGGVYVTNAVKHFKWERGEKGKRRIHKTPNTSEVRACHPWLEGEIALVRPRVIVCLGATAAQALLGKQFRVTQSRGRAIAPPEGADALARVDAVFATVHPSSVLRAPDPRTRERAEREFRADLKKVAGYLKKG
ncbi:MAG TPA: UdgX family uracil-DNA binding protein [Gemmatimonadaceae bacterium]|nr:UdgX family uracil-DNA binding protein [Gemmatimonadaceae bacterium]